MSFSFRPRVKRLTAARLALCSTLSLAGVTVATVAIGTTAPRAAHAQSWSPAAAVPTPTGVNGNGAALLVPGVSAFDFQYNALNGTNHYVRYSFASGWQSDISIGSIASVNKPAVASLGSTEFVFWKNTNSGMGPVYAEQGPPNGWTGIPYTPGGNPQSFVDAAATYFNGNLYLFTIGNNNYLDYQITSDGVNWAGGYFLTGKSDHAVAPVVFNNRLYQFFIGQQSRSIIYTSTADGTTWSAYATIPNNGTSDRSPCAVVLNNKLYVFIRGDTNHVIYYTTTTDGTNWSTYTGLSIGGSYPTTDDSPSVLNTGDGHLSLFYYKSGSGSASGTVYRTIFTP